MRLSNKIVLASTNVDKLIEFQALFSQYPDLELVGANEYIRNAEKISLAENYMNYLENAIAKSRLVNLACHYPSLADDTGLEVDALEGRPGVRSARYAIPKAGQTQSQANIEKLLSELKGKTGSERKARFVCTLALTIEGILLSSTGILEGLITEEPRGDLGFGYDSVFLPNGCVRTLGEMPLEEKNAISHRARALEELMKKVKEKGITFVKP
jgi:XTP/dITP diphosphohydrolase